MALNPYTLYNLYEKGILEYVPTDLMMGTPMGAMMPMSNPYLDMAKQGGLYQNHGTYSDSFQMNNGMYYGTNGAVNPYVIQNGTNGTAAIGSKSNTGIYNTFNGYGIGTQNVNSVADSFGFNNINGVQSNSGIMNSFGFSNSGFLDKTVSIISSTPKIVLGIIAGGIGIAGLMAAFKRGKKPTKTNKKSFLSKLKFWKKEPPKTTSNKTSFWSKLKFWKKK